MNSEVKLFLESGLLEEYLLGLCEESDRGKVEAYINKYPEIRSEYEALQSGLEQYAKQIAIAPPAGTKSEVIAEIDRLSPTAPAQSVGTSSFNRWIGIAAALMAVLAFWFWSQWSEAQRGNEQIRQQMAQLQQDCEAEKRQFIAAQERLEFLRHPGSQKLLLKTSAATPEFEAVAYWNNAQQASFIEIIKHPKLEAKECLQLWADVDGKMVSLGVLPNTSADFHELPFKLNAESLNVTIEPAGGSEHPNVSRLITSISI